MKKLLLLLLLPFTILAQGPPCVQTLIIINLDQYQSETSWDVKDTSGNVVANGGGYWNQADYAFIVEPVCLPVAPLIFTIYDSYGDGLNGSLWGGLDGSYYLIQCNDTLIFGDNAAFGFDTAHAFGSDACPPVFGCMDPMYIEFNPMADTDDGSCNVLKIFGCIDSTMYNYDSIANTMALIPNCNFTLTLTDLMGDGWVGSSLEVKQDSNVWYFSLDTALFSNDYTINLQSPKPVSFKFFVSQQAAQTAAHCGYKLTNPEGQVMIEVLAPFIQPLFKRIVPTYCGNLCVEKIYGCMDSLALNYVDTANTNTSCFYVLGCTNSSYLEYYTQGYVADTLNNSCVTLAVWGCTDTAAFNYDSTANIDNGGCVPIVLGCMQPLAFNYNPQANTSDTCIAVVYGCMSTIALNYNPLANTDDGSCIGVVYGCTDTLAFNWNPNANVIYGCINPVMFNYCDTCNTNDGSCIEVLYGCIDSTMFNFNPLANVDNNSCVPFIYGCTDPSMLNYSSTANTEDFSCIPYVYGCMDSTAINYDTLVNTDNGSCIETITGCRDPNAYNYNPLANVLAHDSLGCLYAADWCINGSGNPFFLNDECYAWVIEVDEYCCYNEWDTICQLTYDHCVDGWTENLPFARVVNKDIIVYPNPTKGIVMFNKNIDVIVCNIYGKQIINKNNISKIDLSEFSDGIYNISVIFMNKTTNYKIIKQ